MFRLVPFLLGENRVRIARCLSISAERNYFRVPGAILCRMLVVVCALSSATGQSTTHTGITHTGNASAAQLHEAIVAAQQGDGRRALDLTRALVVQHPEFAPALKFQGALLEQMGKNAEAAASFAEALKFAPNDPELLLKVGVNQLVAGDTDQAIRLFLHGLKLLPKDGDTLFYLAQAYHLKGENDLALKTIKTCLQVQPNEPFVWQKYGELLCSAGNNEAALTWLEKARQADPTLDRIDLDLGVASYNNMDLTNALEYSKKAVAARPGDTKALELLATSDTKLAKWQDAEPVYAQLLSMQPNDPSALLGLGHCELEMKDYGAAVASFEKLLQLDPTQILAHFYLSRAYTAMGKTADAEHEAELHTRMLEQAASLASSSESEEQKVMLAQARQLLQSGHEAGALQLAREHASGPDATPGAPYMLVGALYASMGRTADAVRCLHKSLEIEPAVHGAHTYLGILAMQAGNLEGAESEFKAELRSDPSYQLASAELGELRYREGRWSEAAEQLAKSKSASPYYLYMLCDSYFHTGKVKEADVTAELIVDYGKGQSQDILRGVIDLLNRNQQTELAQRLAPKVHLGS